MSDPTTAATAVTAKQPKKGILKKSSKPTNPSSSAANSKTSTAKKSGIEEGLRLNLKYKQFLLKLQSLLIETEQNSLGTMKKASLVLRPSDYEEVVVERSTGKICGYPSCNNAINNATNSSGKYRLSLSQHKVFDATEGYRYCSDDCMISSEQYKYKLLHEPLYLRKFNDELKPTTSSASKQATTVQKAIEHKEKEQADSVQLLSAVPNDISSDIPLEQQFSDLKIVENAVVDNHNSNIGSSINNVEASNTVEGYQIKLGQFQEKQKAKLVQIKADKTNKVNKPPQSSDLKSKSVADLVQNNNSNNNASVASSSAETRVNGPIAANELYFLPNPNDDIADATSKAFLPILPANQQLQHSKNFANLGPTDQIDYLTQIALEEMKLKPKPQISSTTSGSSVESTANQCSAARIHPNSAGNAPEPVKIKRKAKKASPAVTASAQPASNRIETAAAAQYLSATAMSTQSARLATAVEAVQEEKIAENEAKDSLEKGPIQLQVKKPEISSRKSLSSFAELLSFAMHWATGNTREYLTNRRLEAYKISLSSEDIERRRQESLHSLFSQHLPYLNANFNNLGIKIQRNLSEILNTFLLNEAVPTMRTEQIRFFLICLAKLLSRRSAVLFGPEGELAGSFPANNDTKLIQSVHQLGFELQQIDVLIDSLAM
jgi:hypothetical protein